jgi:hypothetical protein
LVALPGLEPGLFALRGRRVNQLHHNAMRRLAAVRNLVSIAKFADRSKRCRQMFLGNIRVWRGYEQTEVIQP